MLPGMEGPGITLYGICWLCSLPALASMISLIAKKAQFLPMVIWAATAYNLYRYDTPGLFIIGAIGLSIMHTILWYHEEYWVPKFKGSAQELMNREPMDQKPLTQDQEPRTQGPQ